MGRLIFEPQIPFALWIPLALASAGMIAAYALASRGRIAGRRRRAVLALMAVGAAVPLIVLLNPTWQDCVPPLPGKPLVTVLVDRSASMAVADAEPNGSRYAAANQFAAEAAKTLGSRFDVETCVFSERPQRISAEALAGQTPDGAATDLAAAIDDALAGERPQGQAVLLLTDGAHNQGAAVRVLESAARAKAMASPVFVKSFGGTAGVRDLDVSVPMPEELAFIGRKTPLAATLCSRGGLAGKAAVSLVLDGKPLERRDVELRPNGEVEATFEAVQEKPGLYRYEIRAEPMTGEATTVNNAATVLLRVTDRPVRVLLLEGKPYWDAKFLVRTLAADPSIELTSLVRMAEGRLWQRKIRREMAAEEKPAARDEWSVAKDAAKILAEPGALDAYQIVVLGRNAEVFLNRAAVAALRKWLTERDGSLVCYRGAPSSQIGESLGELLPIQWTPGREARFRTRWTQAGQSLRWLAADESAIESLPSMARVAAGQRASPLAVVLAAADGSEKEEPVITYQPVGGTGRTVVVEGAGMWRWAFLPPQHQERGDAYAHLWRSLIRWLVANVGLLPSEDYAIRADKVTFSASEPAAVTLLVRPERLGDGIPKVELTGKSLESPRIIAPTPLGEAPGQLRASFGRLPEGHYRVQLVVEKPAKDKMAAPAAAFDVRGNLKERLEVQARPDLLRAIAEQSGGEVLETADPGRFAERFERHLAQTRPDRIARSPAWDRAWVLAAALAIWGACWIIRRRSGLV